MSRYAANFEDCCQDTPNNGIVLPRPEMRLPQATCGAMRGREHSSDAGAEILKATAVADLKPAIWVKPSDVITDSVLAATETTAVEQVVVSSFAVSELAVQE